MAKKEKRPSVHKIAIRLLKRKKPERYIGTILELLEPGTVVPPKAIPGLIDALDEAVTEIVDRLDVIVGRLEEQREEAKKKGKRAK